jgi:hypothetical protein
MQAPIEPFLDRSAFRGPCVGVEAFRGSFVGQARFNGCIVFCNWPRRDVAKLLPDDLELAANFSATPHLHPVAFVFGDQTEGATLYAGLGLRVGISYQEFALAVPFVRHAAGRYLHTYLPRMVSSHFPATWSGNVYYGFPKRMGHMWWQGPVFLMTDDAGRLLLHAQVESAGAWRPGAGIAELDRVRAVFGLPVLGRLAAGRYVCSYFDWDFAHARVRPIDALISIDSPFADRLEPGSHPDVASASFRVEGMAWRLSWPGPCRL